MHATIVPPKIAAALESGQLVDGVKPESPVLKEVRTFPILIVLQNGRRNPCSVATPAGAGASQHENVN